MNIGQKYILATFNGTTIPDGDFDDYENYWELIGEHGTLIMNAEEAGFPNKNRVLIQFDLDVKSLGLECHNEQLNALWILKTDLMKVN